MKRLAWAVAAALPLLCWGDEPAAPAAPDAPAAATAPAVPDAPDAAPAGPTSPRGLIPLTTAKPRIPDEACQQRLAGSVDLDFVVMPDGKVAQVVVTASQPKGVFDAAAAAAVAESTYAPQPKMVKLHQRMLLDSSDCRSEQLRLAATSAGESAPVSQIDCITLAAEAKGAGERFEAADSGRAVLQGEGAQAYWAPSQGCPLNGRKLRPGTRLSAHVEYRGFSLVSSSRGAENSAVWVRSNQLKDVEP